MKSFAFVTLCLAALLSGCESMSSRVHERFTAVEPQTRAFAADRRAVYAAGQTAVKNLGLLLGHTSLAGGRIDAYAPIRSGDLTRDTRQTTLEIRLTETDAGETQVALLVSVSSEGNFPGGVSQQAMRVHSLYEMYFSALQQVLVEDGVLKTAEKP